MALLLMMSLLFDSSSALYLFSLVNNNSSTYLPLFFIEFVIAAREALHRDKQIAQVALEFLPFSACVEKLPHECLDLYLVQVREEGLDAFTQNVDNKFFV